MPNRVRRREPRAGAVGAAAMPSAARRAGAEGGDTTCRSGSAGRPLVRRDDPDAILGKPARDDDWRFPPFRFSNYTEIIKAGWPDDDIERFILRDLGRTFHALGRERQEQELERGVELTHTKWDALIAATAEQLALTHDLPVPSWVDEPERFLDETWVLAEGRTAREFCLMFAPGPFLRHGAVPDPGEFNERTGDTSEWEPRS